MSYIPNSTLVRYLIRTARGYFRHSRYLVNDSLYPTGVHTDWTNLQSEAQLWVDIDECHNACRKYSAVTGESAVVVVTTRPAASSGIAVGASS